ncbi:phage tail tape measure protein [Pseudophaeobacter flagellatus]|uniref:phage tail tape measure protein n=1 Tax=Pseudophaeobacter flagellatus TaxID=2899119 RepID=UPI001E360394|nr:phage tail tape measure protein [Pseudophaeobacter flagellatus]MCD9147694.1 phage tail tape measure protein [Pseudophaeobacter flagellatus]
MADSRDIAALELQSEALGDSLGDAAGMAANFEAEMRRVRDAFEATGKDVETLERGLSRGLRRSFEQVVFDGDSLSSALDGLAQSLMRTTYNAAIRPVTDHVGGLVSKGVGDLISGLLPFAEGAAFSQGQVMPFARGGVVSSATSFPMRGGIGLMGEAGPEAILPLSRGADGSLGVRSQGGGASVVVNVTTPDVQGFARSRGQIAAQLSRALSRGNRNR